MSPEQQFQSLLDRALALKKEKNNKEALKLFREIDITCPSCRTIESETQAFNSAHIAANAALNVFSNYLDCIANCEYAITKLDSIDVPPDKPVKLFRNFGLALQRAFRPKMGLKINQQSEQYLLQSFLTFNDKLFNLNALRPN